MVVRNKILFSWIIIVQFFYFQPLLFWIISKRKLDDNRNHFGISLIVHHRNDLIVHHRNDISNINVQFFYEIFWFLRAVNGSTILNGELLFQFNFFCIVHV